LFFTLQTGATLRIPRRTGKSADGQFTLENGGWICHLNCHKKIAKLALSALIVSTRVEANIAVTPACHVTLDVQVVEPAASVVQTATILGMRASLDF
jgi:hypothetical protein